MPKIAKVIFFGERAGYLISNSVSIEELNEIASSLGDKVFSFNRGLERFYAAEKMLELIDGIDQAWILSGQTIYTLLDELSDLSQSKEFKQRLKSLSLQEGKWRI
jgi:hypothetical protein